MTKLIRANIYKLIKSKIFYVSVIFTALFSAYICAVNYSMSIQESEYRLYINDSFFTMYMILPFVLSIFSSLFTGAEYGNGALRNKIACGHTRGSIYFSNLILNIIFTLFLAIIHTAITLPINIILFEELSIKTGEFIILIINAIILTLFLTALFTAISLNFQNKTIGAITSLIVAILLFLAPALIMSALAEPEVLSGYTMDINGTLIKGDPMANPNYVGGMMRTVYQWIYDILPTGQIIDIVSCKLVTFSYRQPISLALAFAISFISYVIFKKKDIK